MPRARNQYTVYHLMEHRGVFDENPSNACSPEYGGPQEYPKMLYHPEGKERITQAAEVLETPIGPKLVGEQREIISRVVKDAEEEAGLRAEGWHLHPAQAIAARGDEPPPTAHENQTKQLEAEIARLQKLVDAQKATVAVRKTKATLTPAQLGE